MLIRVTILNFFSFFFWQEVLLFHSFWLFELPPLPATKSILCFPLFFIIWNYRRRTFSLRKNWHMNWLLIKSTLKCIKCCRVTTRWEEREREREREKERERERERERYERNFKNEMEKRGQRLPLLQCSWLFVTTFCLAGVWSVGWAAGRRQGFSEHSQALLVRQPQGWKDEAAGVDGTFLPVVVFGEETWVGRRVAENAWNQHWTDLWRKDKVRKWLLLYAIQYVSDWLVQEKNGGEEMFRFFLYFFLHTIRSDWVV